MIHRGQIVEKIVRKTGYSLTKLAEKLDISRNTIYNKFNNPDADYRFITKIGNAIHYDFSIDFPELKEEPYLSGENAISGKEDINAPLWRLEAKYTHLLEKYTKLLEMVVKIGPANEAYSISQEIQKFIEK